MSAEPATPILESCLSDPDTLGRPLCVELDGALVTTDTLWEGLVLLLRRRPWLALLAPLWMLGGRARLRRAVAEHAELDPASLPYRHELLEALRASRERGRRLVLATRADRKVAEDVARHLALFDAVHASDGIHHLDARAKRDALRAAYGEGGFDFVSGSRRDAPTFGAAARGYLVGASRRSAAFARKDGRVTLVSRGPSTARALVKELRVHQWAKNALVLLPVLLAPGLPSLALLARGLLALVAFSLCASAGYVFNDLLDLEADRAHATKCQRPFASGALPVAAGPPLFAVLLVASFGLSLTLLPRGFCAMLVLYFAGTLSYSLYFKRLLLLDVLVLAGLYTHRILSGGVATGVRISAWLLGFSMFLFTSLAFAKRYVELLPLAKGDRIKNRGYQRTDLEMVGSMGTASGYIAALVFMLYVESSAVRTSYREPRLLWFVLPVLLYWLGRIWILAGRGQMQDDPVKFAVKDRHSLACGVIIALVAVVARFTPAWLASLLH